MLLVGVVWIVAMTVICYVGIEISANFQKALLGIELTMLLVLSVVALVKVGNGSAPVGHLTPAWSWFNPFKGSFSVLRRRLHPDAVHLLGLGHVGVGQRGDRRQARSPGRAAVISTLVLLVTYVLVVLSTQSYAGIGTNGHRSREPGPPGRRLSVLGRLDLRLLRASATSSPTSCC